jgi:hypothetical protein
MTSKQKIILIRILSIDEELFRLKKYLQKLSCEYYANKSGVKETKIRMEELKQIKINIFNDNF